VAWANGDLATAEDRFRAARASVGPAGGQDAFEWSGPLARIMVELGRDTDAGDLLVGFRDDPTDPRPRIAACRIGAVIAARRGDLAEALRLSADAEAMAAATDFLIDQGDAALDRAEVLSLAVRTAAARASAEEALDRFERKEYAIGIRRARAFVDALPVHERR
jgi:hypothetical protein